MRRKNSTAVGALPLTPQVTAKHFLLAGAFVNNYGKCACVR